jgi:CheY-like chemotaxis protein
MEAIGTLAGGIAHDFNNIIYAITGYAELAMVKSSGDGQIKSYLEKILKAAGRAGDMVKQILSFSRKSEKEKKVLNIAPIVKECLKFLRGAIPTTVEIKQGIAPDLPYIHGDPTQIYQVLMNLSTNAVHSMGDAKGKLSVTLASEMLDAQFCGAHGLESPGKYVKLVVEDTGPGIPDQIVDRIFEPYFTTKSAGEGTGLGLSVIYEIVRSHNGAITVDSQPGHGARFNIFFPAIEGQDKIEEESASDDYVTCSGRIMWVDDELVLIQMYKATLESLGFEVTATSNPLHALELFRQNPESFDAIITDLTMPKMTGMELASEINSIRPDMPIIICTGFDNFRADFDVGHFGIQAVLRKPVPRAALARTISSILDREYGQ